MIVRRERVKERKMEQNGKRRVYERIRVISLAVSGLHYTYIKTAFSVCHIYSHIVQGGLTSLAVVTKKTNLWVFTLGP